MDVMFFLFSFTFWGLVVGVAEGRTQSHIHTGHRVSITKVHPQKNLIGGLYAGAVPLNHVLPLIVGWIQDSYVPFL